MKKLALTLFVILGLTSVAQAQSDDVPLDLVLPMASPCGDASEMRDSLRNDYFEIPLAGGIGAVRLADGEFINANIRIYVSRETYDFSILAEFNDGIGCILTRGSNFGPIIQDKGI